MEPRAQTKDDSRLALESIRKAQTKLIAQTRNPLWLTALTILVLASMLIGTWVIDANDLAMLGGAVLFLTLWSIYAAQLRRRGLKIHIIPSSSAGRWFLLAQAAVYIGIIITTEWLIELGHNWAGWVATVIICVMMGTILHFFPTCEPITRVKSS